MTQRSRWLLVLLMSGSCTDAAPPSLRVVRTDSAGVELIRNTGPTADTPSGELRELLRIGSVDGPEETQFFRLAAIAVHADGNVFALDRGNGVIRVFDPSGRFLRSFGRQGEGPGEFTSPYAFALRGDTLVVLDRLVHAFLVDGDHLWSTQLQLPTGTYLWTFAAAGEGWLGDARSTPGGGSAQGREIRTTLFGLRLGSHELAPVDTVTTMPGSVSYLVGAMGFAVPPLFAPEPKLIPFAGGLVWVDGARYVIELLSPNGALQRRISVDVEPRPVTSELIDQYLAAEKERLDRGPQSAESQAFKQARLELRLDLPTPERRPTIGRVLVSGSGGLLLERLDLDETPFDTSSEVVWDYIAGSGELLRRIRAPASVRPLLLRADSIWAAARDELDVEHMVKYVLVPRPTS